MAKRVDKSSMPCNKPRRSTRPGKKKMVKGCEGGTEKIIHFGAKGYGHNYSTAARKSFRARHKCGTKFMGWQRRLYQKLTKIKTRKILVYL